MVSCDASGTGELGFHYHMRSPSDWGWRNNMKQLGLHMWYRMGMYGYVWVWYTRTYIYIYIQYIYIYIYSYNIYLHIIYIYTHLYNILGFSKYWMVHLQENDRLFVDHWHILAPWFWPSRLPILIPTTIPITVASSSSVMQLFGSGTSDWWVIHAQLKPQNFCAKDSRNWSQLQTARSKYSTRRAKQFTFSMSNKPRQLQGHWSNHGGDPDAHADRAAGWQLTLQPWHRPHKLQPWRWSKGVHNFNNCIFFPIRPDCFRTITAEKDHVLGPRTAWPRGEGDVTWHWETSEDHYFSYGEKKSGRKRVIFRWLKRFYFLS